MTHMRRKLTLLLMCLLLLGGAAMASSGEIEADASEEISEEITEEAEAQSEATPTTEADPSARDYINYYLMPGDSPYLEVAEAAEYIYTTADESNYEQIVFSAMDWNGLSDVAQAEVDAVLPEGYLALLQEAVDYAAVNAGGVIDANKQSAPPWLSIRGAYLCYLISRRSCSRPVNKASCSTSA